jgi:phosphoribosylformylglycinamidine synthase
MALAAGIGVTLNASQALSPAGWFFGEDQGRYLLACRPDDAPRLVEKAIAAGVEITQVGETGGDRVALGGSAVVLTELRADHEGGFARMMDEA